MAENPEKSASESRRSPRIDAKIEVQFRSGDEFIACYTQNLSKGGIYLETEDLPDPNAVIELVLKLPSNVKEMKDREISLHGRVARLMTVSIDGKRIHKAAIQFIEVAPEVQLQIDHLFSEMEKLQLSSKK